MENICIMDYPTAWEFTRKTPREDHDEECSYSVGGLLCDCHILNNEYERRRTFILEQMAPETWTILWEANQV